MTYVKTYFPTLKTHVVNPKRDAKDLSRDFQRLEVRGKLGSKTLYCPGHPPGRHAGFGFLILSQKAIIYYLRLRSSLGRFAA